MLKGKLYAKLFRISKVYKALLSVVDHPSLQDATRLMGEIDQYELRPEVAQTWGYAEMMFREKYSALPEELFQTPQAAQIGQKMLDDRLGVITEYGLIRRKDGQPLPVFQPEQEIKMRRQPGSGLNRRPNWTIPTRSTNWPG